MIHGVWCMVHLTRTHTPHTLTHSLRVSGFPVSLIIESVSSYIATCSHTLSLSLSHITLVSLSLSLHTLSHTLSSHTHTRIADHRERVLEYRLLYLSGGGAHTHTLSPHTLTHSLHCEGGVPDLETVQIDRFVCLVDVIRPDFRLPNRNLG